MSLEHIKAQMELSKKAIQETQNQSRIFEQVLQEAVEGAPNEDKMAIHKLQNMSKRAIALAREGKLDEAQNLIKSFSDAGKSNK